MCRQQQPVLDPVPQTDPAWPPLHLGAAAERDLRAAPTFSGTAPFMLRALEATGATVTSLYNHRYRRRWQWLVWPIHRYHDWWTPGKHEKSLTPVVHRGFGRWIARLAKRHGCQALLTIWRETTSAIPPGLPVIYWTDATWASIKDDYDWPGELSAITKRRCESCEQQAIARADLLLYSSDWAAESALRDYGADPDKVHVVPFGPNVDAPPSTEQALAAIDARAPKPWRLLFCGAKWRRKRGDLAIATARSLHQRGVDVRLDCIGDTPDGPVPPYVHLHGRLDKRNPDDRARFEHLFQDAHLLMLPTQAECLAQVLLEAASFGVPSITTRVGGIPTFLDDGVNGCLMAVTDGPDDYAERIEQVLRDPDRYRAMARAARTTYEARFNWSTAGRRVRALIAESWPRWRAAGRVVDQPATT